MHAFARVCACLIAIPHACPRVSGSRARIHTCSPLSERAISSFDRVRSRPTTSNQQKRVDLWTFVLGPRESATLRHIAMWNIVFRNIYTRWSLSIFYSTFICSAETRNRGLQRGLLWILDEEIRAGKVGSLRSLFSFFLIKFQANDF